MSDGGEDSGTAQEWIAENRYADSLPRRLAAFTAKVAVEVGYWAALTLVPAGVLTAILSTAELQVLGLVDSWLVVWVAGTGYAVSQTWCFTSDRSPVLSEE